MDSGKPIMPGSARVDGGANAFVDGAASDFFLVAMIRDARR
jgi:hypothetical protein